MGALRAAFGALRPLSRVAVGCHQQLVGRVMSPPAQHHAGAEHAQHLEKTAWVGEETAVNRARVQFQKAHRKSSDGNHRDRNG